MSLGACVMLSAAPVTVLVLKKPRYARVVRSHFVSRHHPEHLDLVWNLTLACQEMEERETTTKGVESAFCGFIQAQVMKQKMRAVW